MTNGVGTIEPFIVVHATKTKGQDFKTNVEVCLYGFCGFQQGICLSEKIYVYFSHVDYG
jgi:hypothetical protein